MPIKIPKGFQRRKSSGTALEELPNPPEPSFRVFERPEGTKSFDGGNAVKRASYGRPLSVGQFESDRFTAERSPNINPLNRGSGGTHNSASSGGHNDNSSSSARFGSTSTLPSSTDLQLEETSYSNDKDLYNISAPPMPETNPVSLRVAGRAFSFGRKKADSKSSPAFAKKQQVEHVRSDEYETFNRQRALTESSYASESTTTPPKLLEGGLDFASLDDGFGSMFESFGKRQSQVVEAPAALKLVGNTTDTRLDDQPLQRAAELAIIEQGNSTPASPTLPPRTYERSRYTPSPTHFERSREVTASPRSWDSDDERDDLINKTQRAAVLSNHDQSSSGPRLGQNIVHSRTMPLPGSISPSQKRTHQRPPGAGAGLRRNSAYASRRDSERSSDPLQDEDAKLVLDSLNASKRLDRRSVRLFTRHDSDVEPSNSATSLLPESPYSASSHTVSGARNRGGFEDTQLSPAPLFDSSDSDFSATSGRYRSTETTPRAKKSDLVQQEERSLFDASPPLGRSAPPPPPPPPHMIVPSLSSPDKQNKVMTPAQFEKYREEQEMRREQYFHKDGSDEEGDDYEDDDEIERTKQLARQRRKQEAHLAVYRQQMMKVTGEQPSDLPNRPAMERISMSAPNLASTTTKPTPMLSFDKPAEAGKTSDEEDEDIPLGVLAAHGFPSKNRPPTALSGSGSRIQYKSESYPPPPASTSGASVAEAPRGLPPFARNLPQDPYYGAGLVNPSNRESLAYGSGSAASVYSGHPANLAPGGLVGVIAGEERARAARRGSPNAQGNYGSPLLQGFPQMPMLLQPGMPSLMTPGEQATVQMSEQMNQMMQMQMQWMQQMQQMMVGTAQGIPSGQHSPLIMHPQQQQQTTNASMLAPPGQQQRPMSTGSPMSVPGRPQQPQQRTMSMMGSSSISPWQSPGNARPSRAPSMMSGALGVPSSAYTPSIAPSERSNIGMPSRYRPVSIAPADEHESISNPRASTLPDGMRSPGAGRDSTMSTLVDGQSKPSVRAISRSPVKKSTASDDDDEEGWEQMRLKREKKQSTRRMNKRREDHTPLDIYNYPAA